MITVTPLTERNGHAQAPRPLGEVDLRELPAGQASDVPRHALHLLRPALTAALFTSPLQPSDTPDVPTVASAIASTVRKFGTRGCTARMAQEFGDHPDTAADRMRWVRSLLPDPREATS